MIMRNIEVILFGTILIGYMALIVSLMEIVKGNV